MSEVTEVKGKEKPLKKEEHLSILDNLEVDQIQEEERPQETVETKKRSRYVTVRLNSTDAAKDPKQAAEAGVDLYPGGFSREMELAAVERGRKNFYLTGLDESLYNEEWEKDFLKESIQILEKSFGKEVLDAFAQDFWKTRRLRIVDSETLLDLNQPDDLLIYWNIKGGGFPYIAKSPDELLKTNARFYLDEPHFTYENGNDTIEKLKDKAVRLLSELDEDAHGFSALFFVSKMLITAQEGVTYNTPKRVIYKSLRSFIAGDYMAKNKKSAPKAFIEAVNIYKTNNKRARVTAIVNDALFYGLLTTNKDNHFLSGMTGFNFKTSDLTKVVEQLMSPANSEELVQFLKEVQQKWTKY